MKAFYLLIRQEATKKAGPKESPRHTDAGTHGKLHSGAYYLSRKGDISKPQIR